MICFAFDSPELNALHEIVGNMHMHTLDSDGHGTHDEVVEAAFDAGLDFIVVTDHNQYRSDLDGYRYQAGNRLLLLLGQEVHDVERDPERSHLLIYESHADLSDHASDPQQLIDDAAARDALTFLAHPDDCPATRFGEPELSWADWGVGGYTGLELWNFMVDFKCHLRSWPHALFFVLFPDRIASGPPKATLERWDSLLAAGKRVVGIGNSDAHAQPFKWGPLTKVIFPYRWLFRAVNTHILLDDPLSGDVDVDRAAIFSAIGGGRCFVSYDLAANPRGFAFSASAERGSGMMGDQIPMQSAATLQIACPRPATLRLIHDGRERGLWTDTQQATLTVREPGAYRVEAYLPSGRPWIFSNPIYMKSG